jgi:hypothetical protein
LGRQFIRDIVVGATGRFAMAKVFKEIDEELAAFIRQQQMFFVASAPLAPDGLVNLSPKGLDSFRILDPHTVAYLDLTGSGIETVAHLKENRRIVFMFCAFEGRPRILRLHGVGEALERGDADFEALRPRFPDHPGDRSIIRASITRIADSCGWGVPLYDFRGERDQLVRYAEQLGPEKLRRAQQKSNVKSIQGLTGLRQEG